MNLCGESGVMAARSSPAIHPARSALLGRDFLLLLGCTLLAFANFSPLLSVLPLWSADGGTGHGGLGGITGVMMAATVAVQIFVLPWALRRFRLRPMLAVGGLLLGAPTLAYAASPDLTWVLGVSLVRGVGFGIFVVAGSAMVAELVPAPQRGRAVGLYGIAVGAPYVLALPVAVHVAQAGDFIAVFGATGLLSMLIAPLTALMRTSSPEVVPRTAQREAPYSWPLRALAAPWAALFATACAMGGATAFIALALPGPGAPAALLVLSLAVIAGRWGAGIAADRIGIGRLTLPGLLVGVVGMAGLAAAAGAQTHAEVIAVTAAALYGLGFGIVQNDTLVAMFHRAGPGGNGAASTVWNTGYDAGAGVGAVFVGLLAAALGIAGAFAATALAMVLIAPLLWTDSRRFAGRTQQ